MHIRTALAGLAACGVLVSGASAQTAKVNIGYVTAADYMPAFVSKENGCFAGGGIDATFTRIAVTTNMPAAMVADTMQIGAQTATLFLPAVENGIDLVAIAGGTRIKKGNETLSIVTSPGLDVKRGADLAGKKIGVPGLNSVADVVFRKWLKSEGVDASKVTIIETPFAQMKDLIKSGQIDAAIAVEPIRTMIVKEGVGKRAGVEYHTAVANDSILAFWTASRRWADKNPNLVATFRKCVAEAVAWIDANKDKAQAIEKQYLGFNTPVRPDWNAAIADGDFSIYLDMNLELGVMKKRLEAKNLVWAQK